MELLLVFGTGRNKKDRGRLKILREIGNQLRVQRIQLGDAAFFSPENIALIRKQELQRIHVDLIEEKQNLEYMRDFQ